MAPGSPSAIQAFSDRPLPERSEAKNSDGSDGQFADLMAQITRAPKAAKAPEPPARPPRQEKGPRTPAAKTQTSPAPEAPTAPVEASPSAVGPKDSTAQVLPSGADGASSVADAKNAQVDPVEPGTPLKADSSPDDAPAAQASVLASLRPLDTLRPLEAVPAKAAAQILTPGDPTTPTAGIPSTNPSNAPIAGALPTTPSSTPAIPVQPQALPPVGEGGATSRGASDPGSLQIQ
ncbi:MAG: hypothetical protein P4L11_12575, partial [Geothrix sp.]|nr:hypothetical protein [Geothrix sp.]